MKCKFCKRKAELRIEKINKPKTRLNLCTEHFISTSVMCGVAHAMGKVKKKEKSAT